MTCACQDENRVSLIDIPDGADGTREVVKAMRDEVRKAKLDPRYRILAFGIVRRAGIWGKHFRGEVEAIFRFVRSNIRYTLDTNNVEVVQAPDITLALGFGDCDDMCVLLATLLESIGHPCFFAALGFDAIGDYSHVVTLVSPAGDARLLALDPTEPQGVGWFPPNPSCVMLAEI